MQFKNILLVLGASAVSASPRPGQHAQTSSLASLGLQPLPARGVRGASAVEASLTLVGSQGAIETDFIVPVPGMRLVNRFLIAGSVNAIRPTNDNNVRCIAVDGGFSLPVGTPFGADTGDVEFGENRGGQLQFVGAIFCL